MDLMMNEWVSISGSAAPRYVQLADQLREQILSGLFGPGELLPSETHMIAEYGVSRITVRQAITLLVEEGLAKRIQGKGTFVQALTVEQNFLGLHNFAQDLRKQGREPDFKIIEYELVKASPYLRDIFCLNDADSIHSLRRLKLSDSRPVMLERLFLPQAITPELSSKDFEKEWLAQILRKRYCLELKRVRKTLQPIIIGHAEAQLLCVPPRSLGLLVDRITFTSEQAAAPILITRSIVPAEAARFFVDLEYEREFKQQ